MIAPRSWPFVKKMTHSGNKPASIARKTSRRGATAAEVAVVLLIIVVFLGLLSMWLLRTRESARDNLCRARLVALSRAVIDYADLHGGYPGYANPDESAQLKAKSWVATSLPFLVERLPTLEADSEGWEARKAPGDPSREGGDGRPWKDWTKARTQVISHLFCPADDPERLKAGNSSYVASCGYADAPESAEYADFAANGIFLDLRRLPSLSERYVVDHDGTAVTILLSENIQSGAWDSLAESDIGFIWSESLAGVELPEDVAVRDLLPLNQGKQESPRGYRTARPASHHPGGVHVVFANTRLTKLASDIDPVVYIRLCTVDDSGVANPWTGRLIGPPIGSPLHDDASADAKKEN